MLKLHLSELLKKEVDYKEKQYITADDALQIGLTKKFLI